MIATFPIALDPISKRVRLRLVAAFALSFALHVMVLLGVPVNPTGGTPDVIAGLNVRLEPPAPELAADSNPAPAVALTPVDEVTTSAVVEPKPSAAQPEARPQTKSVVLPPSSPSGGIELPFIRDPTYYPAKQLDVYPQPLTPIKLEYPESAAAERIDGRLLMLLLIDEFGVVNEASVVEANPEGYFEDTTLSVFRATRFSPAQKQGHPVKSRVLLQVRYVYGESQGAMR